METLREYISKKLFYDDDNYELFSMRREYIIDRLLDLNCKSAGILSETDTMILRKRLGIYGKSKSITEISEELQKNAKVLEIVEFEIYQKIRDFYRTKKKNNKEKMSSLSVHPEVSKIYNVSITNISKAESFKAIKKLLGENRLGYILRDSNRMINIKCMGSNPLPELVHSIGGKFVEELSLRERYSIIRKSELDKVLNSCSEWIMPSEIGEIRFYPHSILELVIASEFGLVSKDTIIDAIKKMGIEIQYPIIYRGNEATMITKENILNMSIEGLGLPVDLYKKITNGNGKYTVLDLITIGVNDKLNAEEIDLISGVISKMKLKMVDDIGDSRVLSK